MKENQRTIITKQMLKEGLLRLLNKKPLDKINVAELCKESEINRTTFYRYYNLPSDILKEMQSEFMETMSRNLKKPMQENDFEQMLVYLQDHADIVTLFIRYNSDKEWTDMFRILHQDMCNADMIRQLSPEIQQLYYTFLSGGTYFLLKQWLIEGSQKTPKEIADIVLSIINKKVLF